MRNLMIVLAHSLLLLFILLIFNGFKAKEDIVVDSDMTFAEAIAGTDAPRDLIDRLCLLSVEYYSFDDKLHRGQLVVNKAVKEDLDEIFQIIKETKFPVAKVIPIVEYNWSDNASMADNNTSAYCFRYIAGTKRFSNHAYGLAIDINPYYNPAVYSNGRISPKGAKYDKSQPGTLYAGHPLVKEFKKRGWRWGGEFNSLKDYQHFDKASGK